MPTATHVRLSTSIHSLLAPLSGLALAYTFSVVRSSPSQAKNTYTMNSPSETPDNNTGDGSPDTGNTASETPECPPPGCNPAGPETIRPNAAPRARPPTVSFAVQEQGDTRLTLYNTLGQRVRTVSPGRPSAGEAQIAQLSTEPC